jgi:uncharacterized protein
VSVNIVRCDDVKARQWKNGGGVTRELLAWPSASEWVIRLSVADIERDGPFSAFSGIDRWFAVLTGNGVRLGTPEKVIKRGEDALNFDGGLAPDCRLIDGPTRDLNLMIRRDVASGWMKRGVAGFEFPATGTAAALTGVFAVDGCTLRSSRAGVMELEPMSLMWRSHRDDAESFGTIDCAPSALVFGFQCSIKT